MAGKKRAPIEERDVQTVKQLRGLLPLLEPLRGVGCERDVAGNRLLHMDEYVTLILLYFFNPIVTSLRAVQQASELKKVQSELGCPRASLGSLSEATQVFRSEPLREIVGELVDQLGALPHDARLDAVSQRLTAIDGTLLARLPRIAQAAWQPRHPDGWRLHAHFEVLRGVPTSVQLTTGRNRGETNEKRVLQQTLQRDRCYVMDRGYEQFSLFNAIASVGSSYVCRVRGDHVFAPETPREIDSAAAAAGVLEDAVGRLGSEKSVRIERPDHPVRLVRISAQTHPHRPGGKPPQDLVLATNLLDVPADVIGLIYRHRWQVELFFRFFKHVLGCRHLLSEDPVGIEIQTYCAIIVCLLISLWTGRKPTLRTFEMIQFYFAGWADEEELLRHLAKLKPHSV